jgi:hypothetical protein
MSASDAWGYFQQRCGCGGKITFAEFDDDCRGNSGSSNYHCSNERCGKEFTFEDVKTFERVYEHGGQ